MKHNIKVLIIALICIFTICTISIILYNVFLKNNSMQNKKIVMVLKSIDPSITFWTSIQDGANVAAKEFGINVTFKGTIYETDITEQLNILNNLIKSKPDAIILAADDYNKLVPTALTIKKAGITLLTIDSAINSDISACFIATDNVKAGKKAGEQMLKLLGENEPIGVVSYVKGSATSIERDTGLRSILDAKTKLYDTIYCGGNADKAYNLTKELLIKYPNIKGIVALNEPSTVGVARAIKQLGLTGKVKIVGFDSSTDEVKFLEEGVINAIVMQNPFNMGYISVEMAVQSLKGNTVDKKIYTDSVLVTKENMYSVENEKLLFPFVE